MTDYNIVTHQMSNLNDVAIKTKSFILKSSRSDRQLMFTKWIDMLIEIGRCTTVTNAAKLIGSELGMSHQAVARYYKGKKVNV